MMCFNSFVFVKKKAEGEVQGAGTLSWFNHFHSEILMANWLPFALYLKNAEFSLAKMHCLAGYKLARIFLAQSVQFELHTNFFALKTVRCHLVSGFAWMLNGSGFSRDSINCHFSWFRCNFNWKIGLCIVGFWYALESFKLNKFNVLQCIKGAFILKRFTTLIKLPSPSLKLPFPKLCTVSLVHITSSAWARRHKNDNIFFKSLCWCTKCAISWTIGNNQ